MNTKLLYALPLCLLLAAPSAWAQSDALRGTWSGHWTPPGEVRDAVTVRFRFENDKVLGEMVNPAPLDFSTVSFDNETGSLVAEVESSEQGYYRLEARIAGEEKTRLNGTLTFNDVTGEMNLTKWTYVPRIR